MSIRKFGIIACALLGAGIAGAQDRNADLDAKQVAAPPADIASGLVRLPEPARTAVRSRALVVPLDFAWDGQRGWTSTSSVPVDADGALTLAVLARGAERWTWNVFDPAGKPVELENRAIRTGEVDLADAPGWSLDVWEVPAARAGRWIVRIVAAGRSVSSPPPEAFLVTRTSGRAVIAAHVTTLQTLSDVEIGLAARFERAGAAQSGEAVVEHAGGILRLPLLDDGRHQDGGADDGLFGALLPRGTAGHVRARIALSGTTDGGAVLERSVQLAFPVIERRALLDGTVETTVIDDRRLRIALGAVVLGAPAKLHVSAEVWGTDASGELVPVCWLSRMLWPDRDDAESSLSLFLDAAWLDVADASAPLVLRRVRVQDPDTHVPHDLSDWMPVPPGDLPPAALGDAREITRAMLTGAGLTGTPSGPHTPTSPTLLTPTLLLVHGYCSSGSIWPAADFTQPKLEFLDPDANRTHDQFALMLRQATSARTSFGVVAHSQGGPAALHLYTYYASGLDHATGPRLIQSVGSPYQGTPLASLGNFACGVNNDMTPAGSATWLAGIPSWARAQVFFLTTSNVGAVCNFLTSLFLADPEDGTTEMVRGQLPGGNSLGHVTGWCHTTGMSNPAQYTDHARNAERNLQAAR